MFEWQFNLFLGVEFQADSDIAHAHTKSPFCLSVWKNKERKQKCNYLS